MNLTPEEKFDLLRLNRIRHICEDVPGNDAIISLVGIRNMLDDLKLRLAHSIGNRIIAEYEEKD